MSKNIAIIGGGGFAKEIIEVIEMLNYKVYGIFAENNTLDNYSYYGYLDELVNHKDKFDGVHIAFGGITKEQIENRRKIINFLDENKIKSISLVSPLSRLANTVKLGDGCYIAHFVYISQDVDIGNHVIVNNRVDIGHDSIISDNVTISPKVFCGGNVNIEEDCLIGVNSTIKQNISIGNNSIIGMSSNIMKNIKPYSLVVQEQSKVYKNFYKKIDFKAVKELGLE
jgi:sugar O-acyltransferase (sialic acid O-acetyltransferase NeuD family)